MKGLCAILLNALLEHCFCFRVAADRYASRKLEVLFHATLLLDTPVCVPNLLLRPSAVYAFFWVSDVFMIFPSFFFFFFFPNFIMLLITLFLCVIKSKASQLVNFF